GYNISTRITVDQSIPKESWYQEAMTSSKNRAFQSLVMPGAEIGYNINTKNSFMAYHRVLRSIASREPKAVLSFYITPTAKDEIIKDIPFNQGEHLLFLDANNQPFHVDDPDFYQRIQQEHLLDPLHMEQKGRLTWSVDKQRYLVVYNMGKQEGWTLVKPIPYSQIYATATKTLSLSILIGLAFLLLSVILVSLISNAITRPVKRLTHQMSRFTAGDFDAEAEVKGRDEIAFLTRHFNQMVKRTNELINERYRMKLIEKNAILKALEAQINPHFLYNALQAISTKALKSGEFDIADMVDALAMTLRYCISGNDIVHAKEELQHIERYLALQKARFGSRLQVEYEWEKSLMELQIPKLSIQTLVENSIKHALEKVSGGILIVIQAHLTPTHAVISVQDNGPGIPEKRLKELQNSFEVGWDEWGEENIGLKNLHTRLKLLYGDDSELVIVTDQPGTKMLMMIPRGGNSHV
ncbi:MAG: sensor histidine kinase, partial [Gorillibacterium sp.]|nr:sensor histidine kinase [Gorillibacterium sp.]